MMHFCAISIAQVDHFETECGQDVSDDATVAAPPQELSTHNRGSQSFREHQELVQTSRKLFRRDVIGIRTKGWMTPASIGRLGRRAAAPAELRDPVIEHPGGAEVAPKGVATEMRCAPRAGKAANIHDELEAVGAEQSAERRRRTRGMADRPNAAGGFWA